MAQPWPYLEEELSESKASAESRQWHEKMKKWQHQHQQSIEK